MTAAKRGRPRGTGIDDTGRIGDAYRLMATDGSISFTSALKRTGTRDPSAIRRCQGKRRTFTLAMREAWRWPARPLGEPGDWATIRGGSP